MELALGGRRKSLPANVREDLDESNVDDCYEMLGLENIWSIGLPVDYYMEP